MRYRFDTFEVDPARGRLLRADQVIPLTGKAFEVLLALVEARGEIVEKDALMRRLWPDTNVEEGNLTQQISTVRKALGESPNDHKYILTIARRGYRFVAPVSKGRPGRAVQAGVTVGRGAETSALERVFEEVRGGRGMLLCVAGEAGIGKSTLVGRFLDSIEGRALILRGRCSERLTPGEAHLPVLEALETFLRTDADPVVSQLLQKRAPSWYAQMAPLNGTDRNAAGPPLQTSQERQKRELAGFLEEVASASPVVVWLDDIHWADPSTLDLLIHLITRCEAVPLMLIGSYRHAELLLGQAAFVQSLREHRARGRSCEVPLGFLTPADVDEYLSLELPGHALPPDFGALLHQRTAGNPLFLTDLVHDLKERGDLTLQDGVWTVTQPLSTLARNFPASIRNLIDRTIDRLDATEHQILAIGSVQGVEFDSAIVGRAGSLAGAEVEERLERLARVHNIIRAVPSHDAGAHTVNQRYAFVHMLHHEALYATLVPSRRIAVSGAVADALREVYGGQPHRIAHQLAVLYEAARRPIEAIDQLLAAAQQAVAVSASREATSLARRGLALVETLPPGSEASSRELQLLITLGVPLAAVAGYANPEVERTYTRALQICHELDAHEALFPVSWGLWVLYHVRADLQRALESAKQALAITERSGDHRLIAAANVFLGYTRGHMGELRQALEHLRLAESLVQPEDHAFYQRLSALDPLVASLAQQGRVLALLGELDEALEKAQQAVQVARSLRLANAIGFALVWQAYVHQFRGERERVREVTGEALALATEHGLADVQGWAAVWFAWAGDNPDESLRMMQYSLDAQRQFGSEIARPHQLALVAEVMARAGDVDGALRVIDEACEQATRTGDVYYEAELFRLKGEILVRSGHDAETRAHAVASLTSAVALARHYGSRLFEERALTLLSSL